MLVEKIDKLLKDKLASAERGGDVFRCSNAGSCTRQIAYRKLGVEGEELSARALKVFRMGDLVELDMVDVLGDLLTDKQAEVVCKLDEIELSGHIDGTYFCPDLKEKFVIDFKSINTRGFARAQKGDVDSKYITQMNCYMQALGLRRAILVYYNKDTSAMCEAVVEYDPAILKIVKDKFVSVKNATEDSLPARDYDIDDKKTGWICSYCPYTTKCYSERKLTFTDKGKPEYKESK